jgi:hypothetical protein
MQAQVPKITDALPEQVSMQDLPSMSLKTFRWFKAINL